MSLRMASGSQTCVEGHKGFSREHSRSSGVNIERVSRLYLVKDEEYGDEM